MQPEAAFKRKLVRHFRKWCPKPDYWHTAFAPGRGQLSGLPDLLFGGPGMHLWMEVKTYDGELSSNQRLTLGRLAASGQRVCTLRMGEHAGDPQVVCYHNADGTHTSGGIDIAENVLFWRRLMLPVCA